MARLIRKLNLIFTLLAAIQLLSLVRPADASAAPTAFLYYPYYGDARVRTAWFDHKYPTYSDWPNSDHPVMVDRTGAQNMVYYNGHDGYDYRMRYEPVLAAAAGTVSFAGWASTNHETNLGLTTTIAHARGYTTRYGHMSVILYSSGEAVGARWQIGTSGNTGNSSAAHLHLTVLLNSRVTDPYGSGGTYPDPWQQHNSGVTSSYLWVANPITPAPWDYWTTTVDDLTSGFTKWCNTSTCPHWRAANNGHNNHMWWTYSNGTVPTYYARWQPSLPSSGVYEVLVHIPNYNATTHAARYYIQYGNGNRTVIVDQHDTYGDNGIGRWVSLGQHYFNAGSGGYVQVSDAAYIPNNYTEGNTNQIAVDAVQWVKRTP